MEIRFGARIQSAARPAGGKVPRSFCQQTDVSLWWLCCIQPGGKRHGLPMHALSQDLPGYFLHLDAVAADGGNDIHDCDDVYSAWSLGRDDHADVLRIAR